MALSKQILNRSSKIREDGSQAASSRSLTKGIRILEILGTIPDPVGLSAIAELVGLGKASTLRLLRTLHQNGYISRDQNDRYVLESDWPSKDQHSRLRALTAAAEPELRRLNAELGETVALAFLFGDLIRVASVVESTHNIHMSNYTGRVLQPYASSLGKSIAAFQSPELSQRLLHTYGIFSLTSKTLTDFRAIQEDLVSVRKQGYAWDREETVIGGICVGAPIVTADGVYASISMSTPKLRFTPELEAMLPDKIKSYAASIAVALQRGEPGDAVRKRKTARH